MIEALKERARISSFQGESTFIRKNSSTYTNIFVKDISESEERYKQLFDKMINAISVLEVVKNGYNEPVDFKYLMVNEAFEKLMQRSSKEVVGKTIKEIDPAVDDDIINRYCQVELTGQPSFIEYFSKTFNKYFRVNTFSPHKGRVVSEFEDITEIKKVEQKLLELAKVDDLTGLYNRRGFFIRAEQHKSIADRLNQKLALFYMDFDRFKNINDNFGHNVGDMALIDTANILKATFRSSDIVARIGGDEFVGFAFVNDEFSAESLTERLEGNIKNFNLQKEKLYKIAISIGVTWYRPGEATSIEDLLTEGDKLMYQQKKTRNSDPQI